VERDRRGQALEEALPEASLPRGDRLPAERLDVVDGGDEPGEQLVRRRAGLETLAGRLDRRRPDLVRPPRLDQLTPAVGEAEVRPEVLVRRADQDVDAVRPDVDRSVRRVVNGVRPGDRP